MFPADKLNFLLIDDSSAYTVYTAAGIRTACCGLLDKGVQPSVYPCVTG